MKVDGRHYRSIWYDTSDASVKIIDQRWLPHDFRIATLKSQLDFATAITDMWVRGAPLIGATAAYGVAMAMRDDSSDSSLDSCWSALHSTRPTAINLRWALDRCRQVLESVPVAGRAAAALELAHEISDEDIERNRQIGLHGLELIRALAANKPAKEPVRILTHCNAGWLATVDFGTATSPMFHAADAGIELHIWVDETRPRNQGALTAWELDGHGIPHSYITDNAGGHLMQHGQVDMVLLGSDRTSAGGDVCNKIGTYLKALAAFDNNVPFYVALPSSTIDWTVQDGLSGIPIEERPASEVTHVQGLQDNGSIGKVQVSPAGCTVGNPAFDVTPRKLVSGLITERGVSEATPEALRAMFPDLQVE
ncbi:S-methyl-5-thioribose-1-phosphate isomerase [Chromatiales bacterium (ex Bugula neritina AB1)]|nr:S-methyl-5-thioribose-1-phosphate isomerase [Chromatiales bacterium (ex Bugula neritina AB1)]